MFEREARLNRLMFGLLRRLLADVEDTQLNVPIAETGNPPAFILAHLAVANDYALRILGEGRVASAEWHKRFGRGASPKDDTSPLPTRTELYETLEAGQSRLLGALAKADPEKMNQPHGFDLFKDSPVETVGDVLGHLLTTHPSFHLGQISGWRRQLGKPPLI